MPVPELSAAVSRPLHLRGTILPGGRASDLFVTPAGTITFKALDNAQSLGEDFFLLPGLTDMHSHLQIASPRQDGTPGEQARASAQMELEAGVLALREPGGPTHASHGIGPHEGLPRIFTAGRFLHPPGGYFPGLGRAIREDELVAAALEELEHSDGWVKLVGDFPSEGGLKLNFTAEQLVEVAKAVHVAGGRLAIHATQEASVEAAVDAGFDSIEHGQGMTERLLERMAADGIAWVPTMVILPLILPLVSEIISDPAARSKLAVAIEYHPRLVKIAAESGVRLLAGTDAGMVPHGLIAKEIRALMHSGMDAIAAIGAGSWDARRYLGLPGLEEGGPADITAYARDPREDPTVLDDPALIVLAGQPVRPRSNSRP
jgi:imidazolonepropionase-like amidohydrolase